jgi:predicted transposase YbfD/YdcC
LSSRVHAKARLDDLPWEGSAFECASIIECFSGLDDPRQQGKVVYPLVEVLILVLLAAMAGADAFTEVERFGKVKRHWLKRFAPFAKGTPPHEALGDIFAALDFEAFQRSFAAWAARFIGVPEGVVAIDGKTARRTFKKAKGEAAIHMVTAYAVERRLVLGQVKTQEKSNEITAIPKLLDALSLAGATVTTDAMGCQRQIAKTINDKGADYILARKDNQPALAEDVRLFDAEQSAKNFADTTVDRTETVDGDHGRIETRTVTVYQDVEWLQDRHAWPGLKSVIKVESRRENRAKGRDRDAILPGFRDPDRAHRRRLRARALGNRECAAGARKGGSYELTDCAQAA